MQMKQVNTDNMCTKTTNKILNRAVNVIEKLLISNSQSSIRQLMETSAVNELPGSSHTQFK